MVVVDQGQKFDPNVEQVFVISGWGGPRSADNQIPISGLLNGGPQPATLHWRVGQSHRARLINISSAIVGLLSVTGQDSPEHWRAQAKDGMDLRQTKLLFRMRS